MTTGSKIASKTRNNQLLPTTPDQTGDKDLCMTGKSKQGRRKLRSSPETPDQDGDEDRQKTGRSRQVRRRLRRRSETPDQTEVRAQDVLASDASKPIPLLGTRPQINSGEGDGAGFSREPQIKTKGSHLVTPSQTRKFSI